jgi:hypothetical protein
MACLTNPSTQHRFEISDKFETPEIHNNLSKRHNICNWNLVRTSSSEDNGALKI